MASDQNDDSTRVFGIARRDAIWLEGVPEEYFPLFDNPNQAHLYRCSAAIQKNGCDQLLKLLANARTSMLSADAEDNTSKTKGNEAPKKPRPQGRGSAGLKNTWKATLREVCKNFAQQQQQQLPEEAFLFLKYNTNVSTRTKTPK